MADWDEDSPRLRHNLTRVLRAVRDGALRGEIPTLQAARKWHADTMSGLDVPKPEYRGRFRGEPGCEDARVWIGGNEGVGPGEVADELERFQRRLQLAVAALDLHYPADRELDADGLAAVIDLCAWTHSEWIRIHPFANGNGRTARIWANSLLMRYGLPPVVRLRPRPDGGYGSAGEQAMTGDWRATAEVFRKMLLESSAPP